MLVVTYAVALAAVAVAADHLFDEIHILHHTHYHNARSIGSTNTNTTLSLTHTHTLVLPAPSEDAAIIHSRAGEQLSFACACVWREERKRKRGTRNSHNDEVGLRPCGGLGTRDELRFVCFFSFRWLRVTHTQRRSTNKLRTPRHQQNLSSSSCASALLLFLSCSLLAASLSLVHSLVRSLPASLMLARLVLVLGLCVALALGSAHWDLRYIASTTPPSSVGAVGARSLAYDYITRSYALALSRSLIHGLLGSHDPYLARVLLAVCLLPTRRATASTSLR